MSAINEPPPARDKLLFTPGPLTTSATVKQAMLRDLGSRDHAFIGLIADIRRKLLELAGVRSPAYEAVPLQGSGTYGLEAVLTTLTPPDGRWLVLVNGAYGARFAHIAGALGIQTRVLSFPEDQPVDPAVVAQALDEDPGLTHVALVHCETTTGLMNPLQAVGAATRARGRHLFVDAMSSFGAVAMDLEAAGIDYLVSSANKCIEGVPGFSFVIARRADLDAAEANARSVCLDLTAQWRGLEKDGQFRFTPPTHALVAFGQALTELRAEGGAVGRGARYAANHQTLISGMNRLGFQAYLRPEDQGYIITTFRYPNHPAFSFERFYQLLNDRGCVIYPGKVGSADCFRVGSIGRLFPADMETLVAAVARSLALMGVTLDNGERR